MHDARRGKPPSSRLLPARPASAPPTSTRPASAQPVATRPWLNLVHLGASELDADPELARTLQLFLAALQRRRGAAPSTTSSDAARPPAGQSSGSELWLVSLSSVARAALTEHAAGSRESNPSLRESEHGQSAHTPEQGALDGRALDGAVERAVALLQLDVRRRWSVQSLAKAVGLSRAALARRFAAALGVSPIAYLTELRLMLAARLLTDSDRTLVEVATHVGYESEFAFSRAFKRRHGLPPLAFRRARPSFGPPRCLALCA
jgi:AraC-like DNA-binding protein